MVRETTLSQAAQASLDLFYHNELIPTALKQIRTYAPVVLSCAGIPAPKKVRETGKTGTGIPVLRSLNKTHPVSG